MVEISDHTVGHMLGRQARLAKRNKQPMSLSIRLLGDPAILVDGVSRPVRGFQAWALLARVVLTQGPLDRRSLAAELFPETVDPLGSLRWCLASLRKALDCSECLAGDPIELNLPDSTEVDVLGLGSQGFDVERAGRLLGEIEPRCSPEFSTWLLVERERIAGLVAAQIRQEAMRSIAIEDYDRAIRLAELGVRRSSFDEGTHILLVKSLALAGKHDAALAHVEATERLFLAELHEKPSAALRSAAQRKIPSAPAGIAPEAIVNSLLQSGLAALAAGAVDAGIDRLRRAANDAERLQDRHLQAKAALELGTALVHSIRGYDDEGSILLRQSTELARQAGDAVIAAAGLRELGYVEALAGRRPSAARYLSEAIEIAEDSDSLAGIHAVIGFNLVDWGLTSEGLGHFETSLDRARSVGNRRREIWSLGIGAWGLLAADRLAEADAWLDSCLALCEEQRWIAFRPWPMALLGESGLRQRRDPAVLRPRLEEAFAIACQMADPCWEAAAARAIGLTFAASGQGMAAMDWLSEARRRGTRDSDAYCALQVEVLASQVEVSLGMGKPEMADVLAREWVSLAARTHSNGHVARAAAFIAGRRDI